MKKVTICGVPEHFNYPWHLSIESGEFEEVGIDLEWIDVPEGTGKMCQLLRDNKTDIAIILTEGIIKDLHDSQHSKIVQEYVKSPLIWGIHVDNNSQIENPNELENKKAAISRMGSGSHLMSYIHAKKMNFDISKLKFEIVNTIDGAVESLQNNEADYFLWEKFTTQPLVDKKVFKRVGECPTPWPCFVIAVRTDFLNKNSELVNQILEIINQTTEEFKLIPSINRTLSERYHLKLENIDNWLKITNWSQEKLKENIFESVQNQLQELKIIKNKIAYLDVVT